MRMIGSRIVKAVPRPSIDSAEIDAAVRVDDSLDDRQAQAGAAAAARSRSIDHVKPLEDMRKVAIGDAIARIAHAEDRIAVARVELDSNAAAVGRVAQRVVDRD